MYDFAHGQSDSIEGITHSLCSLEFEVHRPLYEWYIEKLDIFTSKQREFARLNLNYTIMSKRKLLRLVEEGVVDGWDDPRMPTLSGLRRRGYSPESVREFCERVGVAKRNNVIDVGIGSDGMGKLRIPTKGMQLGDMTFKGLIRYQGPDGNIEPYGFMTPSITVAEPALVVSPTKMNVFYRGVPNPVEVSVPGVPQDKIDVRIDGGHSIKRQSDGTYVVEPNKSSSVREANITVSAELPDGSKKTLPAKKFRVKRIPDPVAFWTGKKPTDKGITKAEILSFAPVAARMEGFDFDVQVRVKSFTLRISKDGSFSDLPSGNNRITPDQQEALKRVRRGNNLYLEDILVSMPDETERDLPPMKLKVTG